MIPVRASPMLAVIPIGVLVFPGTGIQDNLADKARKLGIPVYRFGSGGAASINGQAISVSGGEVM